MPQNKLSAAGKAGAKLIYNAGRKLRISSARAKWNSVAQDINPFDLDALTSFIQTIDLAEATSSERGAVEIARYLVQQIERDQDKQNRVYAGLDARQRTPPTEEEKARREAYVLAWTQWQEADRKLRIKQRCEREAAQNTDWAKWQRGDGWPAPTQEERERENAELQELYQRLMPAVPALAPTQRLAATISAKKTTAERDTAIFNFVLSVLDQKPAGVDTTRDVAIADYIRAGVDEFLPPETDADRLSRIPRSRHLLGIVADARLASGSVGDGYPT